MSKSDESKRPHEDSIKAVRILAQKGYSVDQITRMTGLAKSQVRRLVALTPKKAG